VFATPAQPFLFLGNEIKTCFRPAHRHETEAVQFLKEKHDSNESCFSFTCVLPPGVETYSFSTPIGWIISQAHNPAQSGFDSRYGFFFRYHYRKTLRLARAQKKPAFAGNFFLCSRQESNLEHRYRKPIFYPLNYGSNKLNVTENSVTCSIP